MDIFRYVWTCSFHLKQKYLQKGQLKQILTEGRFSMNVKQNVIFFFYRPAKRHPRICPSSGLGGSSNNSDQRPLCGAQAAAWRLDSCQRFAGDKHKAEGNNKYYQPRLFNGTSSLGKSLSVQYWKCATMLCCMEACKDVSKCEISLSGKDWAFLLCVYVRLSKLHDDIREGFTSVLNCKTVKPIFCLCPQNTEFSPKSTKEDCPTILTGGGSAGMTSARVKFPFWKKTRTTVRTRQSFHHRNVMKKRQKKSIIVVWINASRPLERVCNTPTHRKPKTKHAYGKSSGVGCDNSEKQQKQSKERSYRL